MHDLSGIPVRESAASGAGADPRAPNQVTVPPSTRWNVAQRVGFRFAFLYLVLYNLPFPLDVLPPTRSLDQAWQDLVNAMASWVGENLFNVEVIIQATGSGDTMLAYVQAVTFCFLALAGTLVWTVLARDTLQHRTLHEWLRIYVRFSLGYTMISYGASKVIQSQFAPPTLDRLLQPLGTMSPMGLLWTFMGFSAAYNVFTGLGEMMGGVLLYMRRTMVLGSLIVIAVMSHVAMLNFTYDVPVKLYSLHLLGMALFLAAPHAQRFLAVLVREGELPPELRTHWLGRQWVRRAAVVLALAFLGYSLYATLSRSRAVQQSRQSLAAPLHGVYEAEEFTRIPTQAAPATMLDDSRWRRLTITRWGAAIIELSNDSTLSFRAAADTIGWTLILTERADTARRSRFAVSRSDPGYIRMHGVFQGDSIEFLGRPLDEADFLLTNRGFHWVQEIPFNR
jgi:hypothetical protein